MLGLTICIVQTQCRMLYALGMLLYAITFLSASAFTRGVWLQVIQAAATKKFLEARRRDQQRALSILRSDETLGYELHCTVRSACLEHAGNAE